MKHKPTYQELERRIRRLESRLRAQSPSPGQRILALLAEEWKCYGPPGILDIQEVALRLAMPMDDVHEAIRPLYQQGQVDCDQSWTAVFLTPQGYELAAST